MNTRNIAITRALWSIDNASVDALLAPPPRLELHATLAEGPDGPTVAVAVGAGVGSELDDVYGGALMAAVTVVAIDLDGGAARAAPLAPAHGAPAAQSLAAMRAAPRRATATDDPEADDDGENVAAERIGLDLARFLGVPRDGGGRAVFAWLDGLVSNTVVVETPALAPPAPRPPRPWTPGLASALALRVGDAGAPPGGCRATVAGVVAGVAAGGAVAALAMDPASRGVRRAVAKARPGQVFTVDFSGFLAGRPRDGLRPWAVIFDGAQAAPVRLDVD